MTSNEDLHPTPKQLEWISAKFLNSQRLEHTKNYNKSNAIRQREGQTKGVELWFDGRVAIHDQGWRERRIGLARAKSDWRTKEGSKEEAVVILLQVVC